MTRTAPARRTLAVALAAALLVVPASLAGKPAGAGKGGGSGGTSSIRLAPLVSDANDNGLPNHGDVVTFEISTTASEPYVNLKCYQNGVVVLSGWQGYFDGALNSSRDFGLASGGWQSGPAECVAAISIYTGKRWSQLASTSFHVDG